MWVLIENPMDLYRSLNKNAPRTNQCVLFWAYLVGIKRPIQTSLNRGGYGKEGILTDTEVALKPHWEGTRWGRGCDKDQTISSGYSSLVSETWLCSVGLPFPVPLPGLSCLGLSVLSGSINCGGVGRRKVMF